MDNEVNEEVAVICPTCRGKGTTNSVFTGTSRKGKAIGKVVETKCYKCSGYGKVRVRLSALNLGEPEKP
ncbi:hypothetical protein KAR91_62085 [Candidatus Pacearchaeota archaeon]|nr:hypothetical protein [Candidatus Pacearchaeota archaeon]